MGETREKTKKTVNSWLKLRRNEENGELMGETTDRTDTTVKSQQKVELIKVESAEKSRRRTHG